MDSLLFWLGMAWKILFIVFFFGFCIFIHEFGHLLAAKKCGLIVERFSIGFGPKLWGRTIHGVECILSLLPFGGYVALPQIDLAETPNDKDGKPIPPAKPIPRGITAFAGPFFNILFGFALATIMWIAGVWVAPTADSCIVTAVPPTLPLYENGLSLNDRIVAFDGQETDLFLEELCQDILPDSGPHVITVQRGEERKDIEFLPKPNPEWAAGLRKGDRIIAINGKRFTRGSEEMREEYVYNGGPRVTLTIVRDNQTSDISYSPMPNPLMENLGVPFFASRNAIAIRQVFPNSQAANAGLLAGDQILQLNEVNVINGNHFYELATERIGKPFTILYSRNGKDARTEAILCPDQAAIDSFGAAFSVLISEVLKGSAGEAAGLKQGDNVIALNDEPVFDRSELSRRIRSSQGKPMKLTLIRDGKTKVLDNVTARLTPEGNGKEAYLLGVVLSDTAPKVIGHPSPWAQFWKVATQTGRTLKLLFAPVTSTITGRERGNATVSVKHMSGPVGIVLMLWYSLKNEGIRGGLSLIILITFSLAFINLLPLPVLDGGHILFAVIEVILRRRLPVKLVSILQNTFAVLIITLFMYITFFDGKRVVKLTQSWFRTREVPSKVTPVPEETKPAEEPTK
ncbi:MAG: site-2 protease family protein [Victivallales bacterium]|nr:site-2 protease family protein [Victivallales bacterium]